MSAVKSYAIVDTKTNGKMGNINPKINIPKIITAGLSGLAGGVVVTSMITPIFGALVAGSLLGAGITGLSEYRREKRQC